MTNEKVEGDTAPRGRIYDRNYNRLVYNKKIICATYYSVKGIKDKEIETMINFLIDNVAVDISTITLREKKDYLIKKDEEYVNSLITEEETKAIKESDNPTNEKYKIQLNKITEDNWTEDEVEDISEVGKTEVWKSELSFRNFTNHFAGRGVFNEKSLSAFPISTI